ncbi:hypothetical protein AB9K26_11000 [Psychroserpens sp. XS_ASV72]|uniref:hypothetical protein n=1 Tax=Psychroserpens sp. XS_ASV72 TaxID=3241293 RepID=UPI0035119130
MKSILLLLSLTLLFSCFDKNDSYSYSESEFDSEAYSLNENGENASLIKKQNQASATKLYKIKSIQFDMIFGVMPIPSSWKAVNNNKENILFEGPNGIKVFNEQFVRYSYSNNPELNYYSEQSGSTVKPPKSIDKVINEDLRPFLESKGLTYLGNFPLPKMAQLDKNFDKALFKSMPENKTFECVVTEWKDQNGMRSLGVIRYFKNYYTTMGAMDWGYTLNSMEAPESDYDAAKKAYLSALTNLQINPNWIQKNNQYYAQKSQQSNAQHQQRMAAIRAQGQAIRNNGNTYSSILDSNHESWKRRNAMTDAGHSNTINSGIWERSTMQDQSGNQYQVEGYYDNVWKGSNDNTYIGTNNTNWNPNIDNATNGIDWEQLEYTDDNY